MSRSFEQDLLSQKIIGCAIEVHRTLGPGLLESVYEQSLVMELSETGIEFERQVPIPVTYKGHDLARGCRADLLVEDSYGLDLKAVETLLPVHQAQTLTYMKLTNRPFGLLLNFNTARLIHGIRRLENPAAL